MINTSTLDPFQNIKLGLWVLFQKHTLLLPTLSQAVTNTKPVADSTAPSQSSGGGPRRASASGQVSLGMNTVHDLSLNATGGGST